MVVGHLNGSYLDEVGAFFLQRIFIMTGDIFGCHKRDGVGNRMLLVARG